VPRVLIVEDELHLAEGLRFNLEAEGYEAEVVDSGERALGLILGGARTFDLVVLDAMLPGKDGFAVVAELRAEKQFLPVLMLTARGRPEDVLKGFAAGADDYLPKPTELAILLARIDGLIRRSRWLRRAQDQYTFAGKMIDFDALELRVGDRTLTLTLMEANLLRYLVAHEGRAVSRGHRHASHRQFHRAAAASHRKGTGQAEASADGAQRRLQVRREPMSAKRIADC
jgi:DNA-binding response OmpR family regulator